FQAEDGIRDFHVTGVQTCALPISSSETRSDTEGSQAMVDFVVEFEGKAAHAAYDPWNGRSATDALEVFTFALNQMREHVRPTVRSEERRVGKEWRARRSPCHHNKR